MTVVYPGKCGFLGCNEPNLPGPEWPHASFMCPEHRLVIASVRENLRKNNKFDRSTIPVCALSGSEEGCDSCLGPDACGFASDDVV